MDPEPRYGVHTLLHLTADCPIEPAGTLPTWLDARPDWVRWAVIRRACARPGWCAVGFRGQRRTQRCAAFVPLTAIDRAIAPEELAKSLPLPDSPRREAIPAIAILPRVAQAFAARLPDAVWGPTGSVGLELASGMPWATPHSDLDLAVRTDSPIDPRAAATLLKELGGLPARVDALVETAIGAVALADIGFRSGPWLLRTLEGPRLTRQLWPSTTRHHPA